MFIDMSALPPLLLDAASSVEGFRGDVNDGERDCSPLFLSASTNDFFCEPTEVFLQLTTCCSKRLRRVCTIVSPPPGRRLRLLSTSPLLPVLFVTDGPLRGESDVCWDGSSMHAIFRMLQKEAA